MATYHCKLNKGKGAYCLQHVNYILREGKYSKEVSGREDLIYKESGNIPQWANSPQEFWKAAGIYERINGVAYYELEIALPNELSEEENIKLVQEYVNKVVGVKPYTFAIHDKPAALNEDIRQPHAHIMFSERVAQKDIEYTREQFFKRYNPRHPERGGAKKDNRFIVYGTDIMFKVRKELEVIINRSYEKNNLDMHVSSATLKEQYKEAVAQNDMELARYYYREPEKHIGPAEVNRIKNGIKNLKSAKAKEEFYIQFASDKALQQFYIRQSKEAAAELIALNKERTELQKQIEDIEHQISKTREISVEFVAEDALKIVNDYIKVLTNEERKTRNAAQNANRFILSEKRMIMIAQSVYTKGMSKKIAVEFNNIKRIERKFNEEVATWKESKPAGLSPVARYKYFEEQTRLENWKADIDRMKAENKAKVDILTEKIREPEAQGKIMNLVEALRQKNDIRRERYKNLNEYSKVLNNQIALCYAIRTKLRDNIYDKDHTLSVQDKVYQRIKIGDVTQAQNVINELRSAVNRLETNRAQSKHNKHFLSHSYDEEKGRGDYER